MEWHEPQIDPSTIALIQYTSGSTSRPKGVVVTHENLLANERMIQRAFGQTEESVIVGWLPLHHDMGLIGNVLQTLYSGSSAILMSPGAFLTQPLRWLTAISKYRATTSGGPDFAYRLCAERGSSSELALLDLRCWNLAFNGSEPVRQETLNKFAEAFSSCGFSKKAFLPCYGLAEATLFVAGSKTSGLFMPLRLDAAKLGTGIVALNTDGQKSRTIVCCGLPADGVRIAIVNPATKRRCASNEVGEIWLAGRNVAKEYFNARRLTQQFLRAHIKDELAPQYLRTGDLGFLHSGCLYVTGRIKDIIIVRGQNHYPEDLERAVANIHPEFRELPGAAFAVEAIEGSVQDDVVVVQEVGRRTVLEFAKIAAEIRAAISALHGLHVRGVVFAKRGAIPRTSSGKMRRQACRLAYLSGELEAISQHIFTTVDFCEGGDVPSPVGGERQAESSAVLEERIVKRLAGLLRTRVAEVNPETALAAVGVDSLAAVQLQVFIQEAYGVWLSVSDLLDAPSIRGLALRVAEEFQKSPAIAPRVDNVIPRSDTTQARLLSPQQEQMWLREQFNQGSSSSYNLSAAIRIRGTLDLCRLNWAIRELTNRHKVLRVVFSLGDQGPVQRVVPVSEDDIPQETHLALSAIERTGVVRRCLDAARMASFDLASGPLVKFKILLLGEQDHALIISAHHIVSDVWSFKVMMENLAVLYDNCRSDALQDGQFDYFDFAAMQHELSQGQARESANRATDAGSERDDLSLGLTSTPTDRTSHRLTFELPPDLVAALKASSLKTGTSFFVYLLAGFIGILSCWSRLRSTIVGVPLWGRDRPGTRDLVGPFAHPVLIQVDVNPGASIADLLREVNSQVRQALEHGSSELVKLSQLIAGQRKNGELFRIPALVSLLPACDGVRTEAGIAWELEALDGGDQDTDFLVTIEQREGRILGQLQIDTHLCDKHDLQRVASGHIKILEALAHQPATRLENLILDLPTMRSEGNPRPSHRIAVASTFTAAPVEEVLSFWGRQFATDVEVQFASHSQVFQQLLDAGSLFRGNQGTNVVIVRASDWVPQRLRRRGDSEMSEVLKRATEDFIQALRTASIHSIAPHIVCFVPSEIERSDTQELEAYRASELRVALEFSKAVGVQVLTSSQLLNLYPVELYLDAKSGALGDIPFTEEFFAALGTAIARKLHVLHGRRRKAVVVDCDGTLWNGVCAEDDITGISVDSGRRWLQEFLVAQHDAGMLLCLCSKNNDEDVMHVFKDGPEMPLKLGHIVSRRINWHRKSQNITSLASELGIGLDSFVFIDDNPTECADVGINFPEILTIQLPANSENIPALMSHLWAFDRTVLSAEDRRRDVFYRHERLREDYRGTCRTMLDFISELDLNLKISPLSEADFSRASELTYRANQFNSVGARISEGSLQAANRAGDGHCLVVRLSDRFGDYGLVGVLNYRSNEDFLVVESMILSCRTLGRSVEERIVTQLGEIATRAGQTSVTFCYRDTGKNRPVREFFESIGCAESEEDGVKNYILATVDAVNCMDTVPKRFGRVGSTGRIANNAPADDRSEHRAFEQGNLLHIAQALYKPTLILDAMKALRPVRGVTQAAERYTPTEEVLAEIWAGLLNIEKPPRARDFFELGGNSMLGVRVLSEIWRKFQIEVPVASLFSRGLTIAGLGEVIDEMRAIEKQVLAPEELTS
jgi:FkbH-like protein